MLPKSQRLNLKKSFKFISNGKRVETSNMKVLWKIGENPAALVGVAVGKKYFPKASERNQAKRLVFQAVHTLYPRLQVGLNLVIMPKGSVLQQTVDRLIKELENVKDLYRSN